MRDSSMKKVFLICALLAAGVSAFAGDDLFGTKYSAGVDYKLTKGLHLSASEEVDLGSSFNFHKSTTSLGTSYKVCDWFKAGLEYSAIGVCKSSGLDWRHRLSLGLTESVKWDSFRFSLKETFQATYRVKEDLDTYQYPRTKLVLKTRAKVSYKPVHSRFTPYAQAELKLLLNGANWTSDDGLTYSFAGHNDVFVNRIRFQAGTKYNFTKEHAIELYVHYDYRTDKDIDYSRTLGQLQTITITKYPFVGLGLGYVYSF